MFCPAAAVPVKRYKKRMQQQIGMCIQESTAPLLQRCSQLAAAGQDTDKRTNEILDDAHSFVAQLADIYDFVSPCFPEKYRIFHVIWKQYHEHLAFMLDCMGACAEQLANADILKACAPKKHFLCMCRLLPCDDQLSQAGASQCCIHPCIGIWGQDWGWRRGEMRGLLAPYPPEISILLAVLPAEVAL